MSFWEKYEGKLELLAVKTVQYGTQFIVTILTHNSYLGQGVGEAAGAAEKESFDQFLKHEQGQQEETLQQPSQEVQKVESPETAHTQHQEQTAEQVQQREEQTADHQHLAPQQTIQAERATRMQALLRQESQPHIQARIEEQRTREEQGLGF